MTKPSIYKGEKKPPGLFSILSSKRTLSSHYLPNKSLCQRDVEIKVSKEVMEKKDQNRVAFTDCSSAGTSFRPLCTFR